MLACIDAAFGDAAADDRAVLQAQVCQKYGLLCLGRADAQADALAWLLRAGTPAAVAAAARHVRGVASAAVRACAGDAVAADALPSSFAPLLAGLRGIGWDADAALTAMTCRDLAQWSHRGSGAPLCVSSRRLRAQVMGSPALALALDHLIVAMLLHRATRDVAAASSEASASLFLEAAAAPAHHATEPSQYAHLAAALAVWVPPPSPGSLTAQFSLADSEPSLVAAASAALARCRRGPAAAAAATSGEAAPASALAAAHAADAERLDACDELLRRALAPRA